MRENTNGVITRNAVRFLTGVALGAIGALLLAPRKGSETREQLRGRYEEILSTLRRQEEMLEDMVEDLAEDTRKGASRGVEQLKDRIDNARSRLGKTEKKLEKEAIKEFEQKTG